MAESIASELVGKLLGHLSQLAMEKIAVYFSGKSKLKKLQQTMEMIQARLVDAERQREGDRSALIKLWLKRLKSALYKLEDLIEQVSFADQEKEQKDDHGGKLLTSVCTLMFNSHSLQVNKRFSENFKAVLKELEEIKSDMANLNFRPECAATIEQGSPLNVMNTRETQSFISGEEVIGRDDDKKAILEMLLHTKNGEQGVSIVAIIGIGGIGKTTLAQLCYQDRNVQEHFELKGWACISEAFSSVEIAAKIVRSIGHGASDPHLTIEALSRSLYCGSFSQLTMEEIQSRLQKSLNGKRFLLVLDDVWSEDRETWLCVKGLSSGGKPGSIVIVTSRSRVVAESMGAVNTFELRGLEEDESWALFRSMAFKNGQERSPNLTSIAREIMRKCANVPLAIRTVAGLLYCKDTEEEWMYFKDSELRMIEQHENEPSKIMSTLKLSYDHLPSSLKQCFAYCSIFPKDYVFDRKQLIWLWMAQGYVIPMGNQSPEDVGHGYFMELLRKCLFKDVRKDEFGRIVSCKMHDLLHDLACEVGDECLTIDGRTKRINDTIRHLSCNDFGTSWMAPLWLLAAKQIRSLIFTNYCSPSLENLNEICSSLRCLRVLCLGKCNYENLPNSIVELKHLRYLKLKVYSEYLPDSFTRLQNLLILDLQGSERLRKLPKGFSKMVSLRHLQIGSKLLIDMPPRFGKLTSLQTLDVFVVGENNGLDALQCMNLAGELVIRFSHNRTNAVLEAQKANLEGKKLDSLVFDWSSTGTVGTDVADEELEYLQPPQSVQKLQVLGWKGVNFPQWGMNELRCLLCNLVSVKLVDFSGCKHLPPFSRLPCLKNLHLICFHVLEFIKENEISLPPSNCDDTSCSCSSSSCSSSSVAFFPSLEYLELSELVQLNEWSLTNKELQSRPVFPRLSKLRLEGCPKLMSMPVAPKLESLEATDVPGTLLLRLLMSRQEETGSSSSESILRDLSVTKIDGLEFISVKLPSLESVKIHDCYELRKVTAESPTSTLRRLEISYCDTLEFIGLQELCALEELNISDCKELDMEGHVFESAFQGLTNLHTLNLSHLPRLQSFPRFLCSAKLQTVRLEYLPNLTALPISFRDLDQLLLLEFSNCRQLGSYLETYHDLHYLQMLTLLSITGCPHLRALPESIGHLRHLRWLTIGGCPKLISLPNSFRNLTALQGIWIEGCFHLVLKCQDPDGEYWPLIQHIPEKYIVVGNY